MRAILAGLILLAAVASRAYAEKPPYRCEVELVYKFSDAEIVTDARSELIGERFQVDRSNGAISGFVLSNEQATQRLLLDRGSNKQAFKVLSVFEVYGPYQAVVYLYVEEFAPTAEKAFYAVSSSSLLTGHCTG